MSRLEQALASGRQALLAPGATLEHAVAAALVVVKAADDEGENWAEDAARLSLIEALASAGLLRYWRVLSQRLLRLLGLDAARDGEFRFDPNVLATAVAAGESTTIAAAGRLHEAQVSAWRRGVANAMVDLVITDADEAIARAIAAALARQRTHYRERGLTLVRGGVLRHYHRPILAALAAGEFDGQNPINVAHQLRQRFELGNYNWRRLARSEIAWAQVEGKRELMRLQGIERYDYVTADDDRVSAICRRLEAAGPYLVANDSSPLPMRDSHPNCRCTISPVLPS